MKNYFAWFMLITGFLFISCEDETEKENINSDDAKLEISMLADQASADITRLTESDGINGALDLLNLLENFEATFLYYP